MRLCFKLREELLRLKTTFAVLFEPSSASVQCILSLKMSEDLVFQCGYLAIWKLDFGQPIAMAVFKISLQAARAERSVALNMALAPVLQ